MKKETLSHVLDSLAARGISRNTDLSKGIQMRLTQNSAVSLRRWPLQPTRVALALAASIVLVTTVYALMSIRRTDPGLSTIAATELNLTETVGNTSVTLEWAYADANRISFAYTMTRSGGEVPEGWEIPISLKDEEGNTFSYIRAFSAIKTDATALVGDAHFDAHGIQGEPETVTLTATIAEDFNFTFTVPLVPAVHIGAQEPVGYAGVEARIESIDVTPSMTRVYFCFTMPSGGMWYPSLRLAFDDLPVAREPGASYTMMNATLRSDGRWCQTSLFLTSYETLPKEVTLSIVTFQTRTLYSEANMRRAAEVYAEFGIKAEVVRNPALADEVSYLLNFPDLPDDYDLVDAASEAARAAMGDPLSGKSLDGPWVMTARLPEE